jgi:hypothetical protein
MSNRCTRLWQARMSVLSDRRLFTWRSFRPLAFRRFDPGPP